MAFLPAMIIAIAAVVIGVAALIVFLAGRKGVPGFGHSVLQDIASHHKGRHDEGERSVRLEHRRCRITVKHILGKHAHFTVSLNPPEEGYPSAFTPMDEETWGRPIRLAHLPTMRLTRERLSNRVGKWLMLNRELQTGDGDFDKAVYVHTNAPPEVIHQILRRPTTRAAIMRLLDAGYTSVDLFTAQAPVSVTSPKPVPGAFQQGAFEGQLDALSIIAEGLPSVEVERTTGQIWTRATSIALTAALLSLAGFVLFMVTKDTWPTLGDVSLSEGFLIGAGLWLLALPVLMLTMRGFSNSFSTFCVAAVCLSVGLPATAITAASSLNALLDDSPTLLVEARVVDRSATRGKNSTTYRLSLDPGVHGPRTDLNVDEDLYSMTTVGDRVTLVTHEGAFGWRWIDKIIP